MASGRSQAMACYLQVAEIPTFSLSRNPGDHFTVPREGKALQESYPC